MHNTLKIDWFYDFVYNVRYITKCVATDNDIDNY